MFLTRPADAADRGIAVIYQEPTLFPDLSVAENVFIGRQPLRSGRRIDSRAMDREVTEIFNRLGVRMDPERIARGLSIADQQLVEIAKALTRHARVLIMDEPTAALSPVEAKRLFGVVETLRAEGAAVMFISHRLEEVFGICQRVTVLRDGKPLVHQPLQGLNPDDLVRAMVGRDVVVGTHAAHEPGEAVLQVERLTREGVFVDIAFEVRAGEVVGSPGWSAPGRTEVVRAVFGTDRYDAGPVQIAGRGVRKRLADRRDAGRDRVRAGGPAPAGTGDGVVDHAQHRAGFALASRARRIDLRRHRTRVRGRGAKRLQVRYGRPSSPVRHCCQAAISRRSCWPNGWPASRRC